ncbi:GNAT family N-acetyltransferase [Deinococcus sp.]|uniref:GNAT family N-acetyltransferase n=1 Tax=Deinococcus sp. TaxID=47478 RepID=UPI002869C179|nr:GNAT family N-acetyltransferase [Deinococcus sp.]
MNSFTILPAMLNTLPDLYALHADPAEAAHLLDIYWGRVERGAADLSHTLILYTERGVEGTVTFGPAPHPYVFPHLRANTPAHASTAFLLALRHKLAATPERQMVLDTSRADVPVEPVLEAGWALDDTRLIYETDLTVCAFSNDPKLRPVEREQPDVQAVLAELGRSDLTLREGWALHGLYADDELLALGAFGSSGRPGTVREAGIDMIGVRPAYRGQTLGQRLHSYLLATASASYERHMGGTSADNHAMRRVFEHSGSVHTGTQFYFKQP